MGTIPYIIRDQVYFEVDIIPISKKIWQIYIFWNLYSYFKSNIVQDNWYMHTKLCSMYLKIGSTLIHDFHWDIK